MRAWACTHGDDLAHLGLSPDAQALLESIGVTTFAGMLRLDRGRVEALRWESPRVYREVKAIRDESFTHQASPSPLSGGAACLLRFGLGNECIQVLRREGFRTVQQVARLSQDDLNQVPGLEEAPALEVFEKVASYRTSVTSDCRSSGDDSSLDVVEDVLGMIFPE